MIIKSNEWVFQVFPAENRKHYARELAEHCTCAECRNFYATVDQVYPELRPFLEQFGIHVEAPEEMMGFDPLSCICYYTVCGKILERGAGDIPLGNLSIEPLTHGEARVNTYMEGPVFFFRTDLMTLPWVLDEPMREDEISPRKKNFIARLLARWITE